MTIGKKRNIARSRHGTRPRPNLSQETESPVFFCSIQVVEHDPIVVKHPGNHGIPVWVQVPAGRQTATEERKEMDVQPSPRRRAQQEEAPAPSPRRTIGKNRG